MMRFFLISLCIAAAIQILVPLGLIASQRPGAPTGQTLDFARIAAQPAAEQTIALPSAGHAPQQVRVWNWDNQEAPLALILHGSGWHGGGYTALAERLAAQGLRVALPDLRGHGVAPERRGDVDYIGQIEDDLAALISAADAPQTTLIGHSSGGGLVLRMAGGEHGGAFDKAVLLAPYLGYNAPTTRAQSGGWAHVATRRIIGLSMLNMIGITALNHLKVISFNTESPALSPEAQAQMTTSYSYRLNTSFAPRRDFGADIAALPDFLLIAGAEDEAFDAALYEKTLAAHSTRGSFHILPDIGHLDVMNQAQTAELIHDFIAD